MLALQPILLIILLLLSGFFSSSEMAFVVSNKIKIEIRARKKKLSAKNASYFLSNPQIFFSTILIANNVINIAFASIITIFLADVFQFGDFSILIISTVLLLLFGELVPKYLAREFADSLILVSANPIRMVSILIYPVVKLISAISLYFTKSQNITEENISHLFDKEDMQNLLHESSKAGQVNINELDTINKIFELSDQKVYEAMTPRINIVGVEIDSSIEEVIKVFIESGYSKLPVYKENLDNIKGVIYSYDMFNSPENLASIMRSVIFVPETKKSLNMLNQFLDNRLSIAVVVDEFGGTEGILTTEDIIEEMLGEIRDEYDEDEGVCKKIEKNTYVINGNVEIDHINEQFDLNLPEGDYETIGGYITSVLGHIPQRGERIKIDRFRIHILHADNTRINLVKVYVEDPID